MNYTYEIKDSGLHYEMTIIEYLNDEYKEIWYLYYLKNNYKPYMDPQKPDSHNENLKNSFVRTKDWVLQNHPELML